ncbi:MAG: hypothetical protein ACP5JG_11640 [Anaerolineae bacterium]
MSLDVGDYALYDLVPVGFEAIYTGEDDLSTVDTSDPHLTYFADDEGHVFQQYSLWGFANTTEDKWDDEIKAINAMQTALGPLDHATREIRAHIASLVGCDNGVPVTIDELLNAIGKGQLPSPPFHDGCWLCRPDARTTQPLQTESMRVMEDVLRGYMAGKPEATFLEAYPFARGFIERAYAWLGPVDDLTEVQRLMLDRMLLPFQYFAKRNPNVHEVYHQCFDEDKEGKALDARISAAANLPEIHANYTKAYQQRLAEIEDPEKRELYIIGGHIADCVSELSDCHHGMLRRIERWIHGIGTLQWDMVTRQPHAEGTRLGRLFFGYALGLDRWLREIPMQFVLLDLGHVDLGFNPKNEILRVYAYLGDDHAPVKRWLAASLWYKFVLEPPASLYRWGWRHKELLARAEAVDISVRTWMDGVVAAES